MKKRAIYTLAGDADRDLEEGAAYLAERAAPDVAFQFLSRAEEIFSLLAEQPQVGSRRFQGRARLREVLAWRIRGFDAWLVFYRLTKEGIEVLRVLHGARDIERLFDEDPPRVREQPELASYLGAIALA